MSPPTTALVHLIDLGGRKLLFDGLTGGLAILTPRDFESWRRHLEARDGGGSSCDELAAAGFFRPPAYPGGRPERRELRSLCLNVAHACNLRCGYCFAAGGTYGGEAALMSAGTARAAVEFLLSHCPPGRQVSLDFFGGEPLLAWDTVRETVTYALKRAARTGHRVTFGLTTNATLVDAAMAAFIARHMSSIIVSLDGRPEVHDRLRPQASGEGSFARSLGGARLLREALDRRACPDGSAGLPEGSGPLWVRGTFTRANLDFWRDALCLADLGFSQVSLEPVVWPRGEPYGLGPTHLGAVRESYARLADLVSQGRLRFFHFELNPAHPVCAAKRFAGCGAGVDYLCVGPDGGVFPCHEFDGRAEFRLFDLPGTENAATAADWPLAGRTAWPDRRFAEAHVGSRPVCRACWAQLHCGGGCHHAAWSASGDLRKPYALGCELLKARLEYALALSAPKSRRAGPAGFGPG